jgi:manganese transport protein
MTIDELDPSAAERPSLSDVRSTVPVKYKSAVRRLLAFLGPAYLISVGYMDPGNWATDIEGGARFGYTLLWVLLMSNLMALLLQMLSARLGIVTGKDLAQACRAEYSRTIRYYLWILAEIAIAATDLAEVLGTIIGLNLLFGLPMLWGCLITAFDTLLLIAIQRFGIRKLEAFIVMLVATIGFCFLIEIFLAKPEWGGIVSGFVPTLDRNSLYIAIGMLGATVMPHNLYLHSALVQSRQIEKGIISKVQAIKFNLVDSAVALNAAFFVNAAILVMAAADFYRNGIVVTEIQQAHSLLNTVLGNSIGPAVFAIALLAAGQSSTITGTIAGQVVMEGFLHIRLKPWIRRLVTRTIALIPAVVVIAYSGENGSYRLLILSQVILSLQLPFAIIPLLNFTSDRFKMGAFANKSWVFITGWITAVIIIVLNANLIFNEVSGWLSSGGWFATLTWIVGIPIIAASTILLAWITVIQFIRRGKGWEPKPTTLDKIAIAEPDREIFALIGVALDNSETDQHVISKAMSLAGIHKAELILIHVTDSPGVQLIGEDIGDEHARDDNNYIYEVRAILKQKGFKAKAILSAGRPAPEIIRIARKEKIDLLLMGSHGHRFLGDMLFGETVSAVRHNLEIPILVVKPEK